jgi:hypothetical protein
MQATTNAPDTRRTFTFENVKAGRYVLADPVVVGNSHRLVGATWNGRDIVETPLVVSGDGPVTGIVVRMSTQFNKVTGTVRLAEGRVATDGAVVAFPVSPTAWLESALSAIRPDGQHCGRRDRRGGAADDPATTLAAISTVTAWSVEPEFLASIRAGHANPLGPASPRHRVVNINGGYDDSRRDVRARGLPAGAQQPPRDVTSTRVGTASSAPRHAETTRRRRCGAPSHHAAASDCAETRSTVSDVTGASRSGHCPPAVTRSRRSSPRTSRWHTGLDGRVVSGLLWR